MRALPTLALLLLTLDGSAADSGAPVPQAKGGGLPPAPVAMRIPFTVKGPVGDREDPYYWMRDDDPTSKRAEIIDYLKLENAYTEAFMQPLAATQSQLLAEMRGRIKEDDGTPPAFERGWWYWTEFAAGAEYPCLMAQAGTVAGRDATSAKEVLLDEPALASGKPYFAVTGSEVSPDHEWIAWTDDLTGRKISTLHIRNIRTGKLADEAIEGVLGDLAWASDSRTIFYVRQDPVLLHSGPVWRHVVGSDPSQDVKVYEEPDETLTCGVSASGDGRTIVITLQGFDQTEVRALPADRPTAEPVVVVPRMPGIRNYASAHGDTWVIQTNLHARNFRLVEAAHEVANDPAKWKVILPERADVSIEDVVVFDGAIAIVERAQANARVRVLPWGAKPACSEAWVVEADESAFTMSLGANFDPTLPFVRVEYQSMVTPPTVWDVDLATRARRVVKVQPVVGYDAAKYSTARLWAAARDGKSIPLTVAWRTDRCRRDGTAPAYIEGYGSYGISLDAQFSAAQVSLLDRGFLVVYAHVRGGADLGQDWYEDGRLMRKRNTFTDFIDATDWLVRQGWCAKDLVFATGGSAGGLLMGVVANEAGGKYRGIALHVPFVDVLTTMLDETIPLTVNEWTQWGDPRRQPDYGYMASYSPYDNLAAKPYPAMLVTTGLWDAAVQYFEPAKYVAKLRSLRTDDNPFIFRVNLEAGHGGESGRFNRLEQIALEYAFFMDLAGLGPDDEAKASQRRAEKK
ncbi:MAG: S9 family peptidase [Planctomycetes bacterium]|nr:S9 family peptidase [Planctomycetota bacterium]